MIRYYIIIIFDEKTKYIIFLKEFKTFTHTMAYSSEYMYIINWVTVDLFLRRHWINPFYFFSTKLIRWLCSNVCRIMCILSGWIWLKSDYVLPYRFKNDNNCSLLCLWFYWFIFNGMGIGYDKLIEIYKTNSNGFYLRHHTRINFCFIFFNLI